MVGEMVDVLGSWMVAKMVLGTAATMASMSAAQKVDALVDASGAAEVDGMVGKMVE